MLHQASIGLGLLLAFEDEIALVGHEASFLLLSEVLARRLDNLWRKAIVGEYACVACIFNHRRIRDRLLQPVIGQRYLVVDALDDPELVELSVGL